MPKLLSRSKHEEFESSSELQIRDQKERRAENARKIEHCEFGSCSTEHPASTVPPVVVLLHFTPQFFLLHFFVSSYFNPCNNFSFSFFFFFVISLALIRI